MLVFATSDKGGTGRSVTTSNVAYQSALAGNDVCYLDFDFGSPTAGAVFDVDTGKLLVEGGGLHSYLLGTVADPHRCDVFADSERLSMRERPLGAGRLTLLPGDSGGGEFPSSPEMIRRCRELLGRLNEEFDVVFVDLSAGRSYALHMALAAVADMRPPPTVRWLVYHRWTQQHIQAAGGLVHGEHGILETGIELGHDRERLLGQLRFVRTAMVSPAAQGLTAEQAAWVKDWNGDLQNLARERGAGALYLLGSVPLDPVLQWREQLITNHDLTVSRIANRATADAFAELAELIVDDDVWDQR
ncbi:SCO2523 family variant P-loop protein [Actinoplanes regularis]|uniref:SCO2523 family variant P-loop protein n=1 Tax=Actinoplanes regularis TaxID=52697 RepID=UPI0024A32301|nr:SCO2523 family variant P-loop protein [Actinoplanes regularis]GLW32469.1 DNA-binding protein [Actinoplanes regularis]